MNLLSARPNESQGNSLATVLTATICTIFTASTKEATKEVARRKPTPPLLWWRPKAVAFAEAVKKVNIVAVKTVAKEFPWDSLGRTDTNFNYKFMYLLPSAPPRNVQRAPPDVSKNLPRRASPVPDISSNQIQNQNW